MFGIYTKKVQSMNIQQVKQIRVFFFNILNQLVEKVFSGTHITYNVYLEGIYSRRSKGLCVVAGGVGKGICKKTQRSNVMCKYVYVSRSKYTHRHIDTRYFISCISCIQPIYSTYICFQYIYKERNKFVVRIFLCIWARICAIMSYLKLPALEYKDTHTHTISWVLGDACENGFKGFTHLIYFNYVCVQAYSIFSAYVYRIYKCILSRQMDQHHTALFVQQKIYMGVKSYLHKAFVVPFCLHNKLRQLKTLGSN